MKRLRRAAAAAVTILFSSVAVVQAAPAPLAAPHSAAPPKAVPIVANGSWPMYHHDNAHTGFDSTQPAALGATTGWVTGTMDNQVYASPLVHGGIVYAATLGNTVYAFNQADGSTLWITPLGAPTTSGWGCGNVAPMGILGTPVIDTAAGRIYVAALGSDHIYRVYGLNLTTGAIVLTTALPTNVGTGFDWTIQQQRGALGLANGYVYVPFGGRAGDCGPGGAPCSGAACYHGWVYGVPTSGSTAVNWYETPSTASGIWAPGGVVIDGTGNVFFAIGNAIPCSGAVNSDSVIRTAPALGLATSFFQPLDWSSNWCGPDLDLGSASPTIISPTLAFTSGKYGQGFLVDPTNLGGTNGQVFPAPAGYVGVDVCVGSHSNATFGSFAYAAPYVYLSCETNGMVGLRVDTAARTFSACDATCAAPSWNSGAGKLYGPPIVAGGVVWAVDTNGSGLTGFDAATGTSIFQSGTFGAHRFSTPSEAGGKVFVSSGNVIRSFNMIVNVCASVTESAAPPSTTTAGTTVTFTATGSGCPNPRYQFWTLAPGSSTWTIAQAYSSTATFAWNTTGLAAGNYTYTVWVRDATSSGTACNNLGCFDAYAPATAYTLTSTPPCTSVTESAAPPSTTTAGTTVTFTAAASGCPNARYQFWTLAPGSTTWTIGQAYSPTTTFAWNTTGLAAGTYRYTVWARDAGSAGTSSNNLGTFDSYFPATYYTLTSTPPCASVTESAAPPSTATAGATVTFTATASGCPNPRYQFWTLAPGSTTWTIGQAYSPTTTFAWNTTGLAAGTYRYTVWARDAGSAGTGSNNLGTFDAYFPATNYTLTSTPPCTSVTLSAAPPSTATRGTAVTFTAGASGCANARYQFWILAPGSTTWTIAQAYSPTTTFTWNTTGLAPGTWRYTVWARDAGSAGTACNNLGCFDTYFPATSYTLT